MCMILHNVNTSELLDTLKDLRENRRLSSESEAILKPFVGLVSEFTFTFFEAGSTFSCRLDDRYAKGKTVVAQFSEFGVECTILFPPSDNEWVECLSKDDQFDLKVVVLELDNLYQRVVFGKFFDGDKKDNFQVQQPAEVKDEKVSQSIVELDGNLETENTSDAVCNGGSSDDNVEEEVSLSSFSDEETENMFNIEEEIRDEKSLPVEGRSAQGFKDENEVKVIENSKPIKVDDTNSNQEDEKTEPIEKPPPLPSLNVQKKAKEIDFLELERIRDKRYDEGAASLTEEEKEILSLASKRVRKSFVIPTSTKNKKPSQKHKADEDNIVSMGCRGLGGILVGFFGLQTLSNGWFLLSLVIFAIAGYLLNPIVKKLRED